ncbi:hypothetical protein [Pleionea litopenaei]|uniref:Uncharacterized protein n=1 Tax=Pleionea litopenaei TaxID=3070815 RepID=A0AA51RUA4_9GAMM|nr:hypothetical protein [Pleionea sp. HL-JVS1]WMS87751.1 hypothetical protein Q9312_02220 [Pleionea sp. HL-JVS1]
MNTESNGLKSTHFKSLASLIGVEHFNSEEAKELPKWRRLEILKELQELEKNMRDFDLN